MDKCNWFYESASERVPERDNVSSFAPLTDGVVSFDERVDELAKHYMENRQIDIKRDTNMMLADASFMETYKTDLMTPIIDAFNEASPGDPHIARVVENVNNFWDNKVRTYTESATMAAYLPLSSLEFPVLVKQFFSSVMKDIIDVEAVKTPHITKHVRTTYLVDNNTGEQYEYPKCMFDGTWQKIHQAAKGLAIREEVVPLTDGRLWKYDIIGSLTDGTPGIDELSWNLKISKIQVGDETVMIPGNGITIEFSTGATLVNGNLDFVTPAGTHVEDNLSGQVDYKNGTISMSSASGQVTGVVFTGYLSNKNNLRSVSVREERSLMKFTIEDGPRWNMPFQMEDIEDAAALSDINYFNRMVDEVTRTQDMNENMTVIKFLCDEQKKFNGIKTDTFKLESLANTYTVDINPPAGFAGDPFKYRAAAIQFRLKGIVFQMTDDTKLDNLAFVLVGNPMTTQLLGEFTNWKITSGTSIGGISVNGSYGFGTDMGGANVRVVGSNLYDAYTPEVVEETGNRELVLHGYIYSTSPDRITFKHLKFTSHLFTSQSQTAYQSPQAPAGAYNIVTATSRFKDIAVQGIQFDLILLGSDKIYGKARGRNPIMGAPWDTV